MYGQMTAGSWIYIGTQGILQGTYETFAAVAAKRFNGTLAGTLTLTGGCGGMGGAQPLAVTMNDGVCLVVDVDETRLRRRVEHRYLDEVADDLDDAIARLRGGQGGPRGRSSIGLVGNCATCCPSCCAAASPIDIVTDQTSRARPAVLPARGHRPRRLARLRRGQARGVHRPGPGLDGQARRGDGRLPWTPAPRSSTTATRSATRPARAASTGRSTSPASCPAYIRPLFCEGKGPFRWAALSGDPKDIAATDQAVLDLFPDNDHLHRWIRAAQDRVAFQGLPARICWLGYGERDKAGLAFNDLVASRRGAARRS